jgi:hypothetical protein
VSPDRPISPTAERLRALQHQLDAHPDDGWSWLWSIHSRVCRYLLGSDRPVDLPPERTAATRELSELKTPYVTPREPTTEELRMRALCRVKAARVMRGMDALGPGVRAAAGIAAEHQRRFQQRHDLVIRTLWRLLGACFVVVALLTVVISVSMVSVYGYWEFTDWLADESLSVAFIVIGISGGITALLLRVITKRIGARP